MIIEKIVEKFKDVLSEEDLKIFQEELTNFINEESQKRADLKIEEKTKAINEASEKYIAEAKEEIKNELTKEYDSKIEQLEEKLIVSLDTVVDNLIEKKINDDLITKIAINETLEPVVNGIKKIFAENHLELDLEGSSIVTKYQTENESLKNQLSESMAKEIQLNETLEKISVKTLISEKINGLKEDQKARVVAMFENKKFAEVEKGIDSMVDLVISEENKSDKKLVEDNKQTIVEGDGIVKDKTKVKKEDSTIEQAKKFFK